MESGFGYRPLIARREGPQAVAQSVMGEFVSGNYFRTFGLQPAAGRFFTDADDAKGAAFTAVMSYDAWMHDYAGDTSIIGSTFRMNTQPVTIIGICNQCHPFYTGQQKFIDTAGRVDKFQQRMAKTQAAQAATAESNSKKKRK